MPLRVHGVSMTQVSRPMATPCPGTPPSRPARRRSRAPRNLAQIQGRLVEVAVEPRCPSPTTGRKPLASKGGKRARTVRAAPPPERRQGHGNHQEHQASHEQGGAPAGAREGAGARAGGARPPRRGRPRGLPVRALGVVAAEPLQVLRLQPEQHHPDSDADAHGHPRGSATSTGT